MEKIIFLMNVILLEILNSLGFS